MEETRPESELKDETFGTEEERRTYLKYTTSDEAWKTDIDPKAKQRARLVYIFVSPRQSVSEAPWQCGSHLFNHCWGCWGNQCTECWFLYSAGSAQWGPSSCSTCKKLEEFEEGGENKEWLWRTGSTTEDGIDNPDKTTIGWVMVYSKTHRFAPETFISKPRDYTGERTGPIYDDISSDEDLEIFPELRVKSGYDPKNPRAAKEEAEAAAELSAGRSQQGGDHAINLVGDDGARILAEEIDNLGDALGNLSAAAASTTDWVQLADMDLQDILSTCDGEDWCSQLQQLEIYGGHETTNDPEDGIRGSSSPGLDSVLGHMGVQAAGASTEESESTASTPTWLASFKTSVANYAKGPDQGLQEQTDDMPEIILERCYPKNTTGNAGNAPQGPKTRAKERRERRARCAARKRRSSTPHPSSGSMLT